ncbi:MAG: hypothetical protein KatS3mg131_1211 [Candidatus Tectimicrobiota bacterium]|nr:MAG: hypothetical protein KatS3mg131_1211 [Candidatus Tectomicrobia bacterium]
MLDELEAFLRRYAGLAVVVVWEDDHAPGTEMDRLLRDIERFGRVPVFRLALADCRDWAQAHGIYGSPALVVYYRSRPLFRLIGRATPAELLQRLRDCGL